MVIHKIAAEIRSLREALEAANNQVRHKQDQIRGKDEQLELAREEIASLMTKMDETGASLKTFKMLFWGLFFLIVISFVAVTTM
jgi:uncharacterized coiled-coil DUF342 family protein